jgi:hypothetical protein
MRRIKIIGAKKINLTGIIKHQLKIEWQGGFNPFEWYFNSLFQSKNYPLNIIDTQMPEGIIQIKYLQENPDYFLKKFLLYENDSLVRGERNSPFSFTLLKNSRVVIWEVYKFQTLEFVWWLNIPRGTLQISIYDNNTGNLFSSGTVPFQVNSVPVPLNCRIDATYTGVYTFRQIDVFIRNPDGTRGDFVVSYYTKDIPSFIVDDSYIFEYRYF